MKEPICVDFETDAIDGNPVVSAPAPVGVAVRIPGEPPVYLPTDKTDTKEFLHRIWTDPKADLLFHNAPFDLSVSEQHLDLPAPPWERVHDTMYLVYLKNPYARSLSLKPSAEMYLDMPPEEQDELHDWILANVPEATKKTAGAYIARAPFELVAKYAKGDVERTAGLFNRLYPEVPTEPYDRERRLAPILTEGTRRGVRCDRERLAADLAICERAMYDSAGMIREILQVGEDFNIGSDKQLAERLDALGLVTEWKLTPKGRRSTSKKNLMDTLNHPELLGLLSYHSTMSTCIGTFMAPWLLMSEADGRLHPSWNAVRSTEGARVGTRTGRLSSNAPNFQNPPNAFSGSLPAGLPPLPSLRGYLLPEIGHRWLKRDFSSQEVRILAHFEDGTLCEAYNADPDLDPHQMATDLIDDVIQVQYPRKDVKITGFSIIYGSGVPGLAAQLHKSPGEAAQIKEAYLMAMPGVGKLQVATKRRGDMGQPIRTWGGRLYYAEPDAIVNGRRRSFSYKLLNYLIQGSAADQTKQCINDWYDDKLPGDTFMATVHDEVNISAPEEHWQESMAVLKKNMNQDLFDVPMRSEGFVGLNWQDIEECD